MGKVIIGCDHAGFQLKEAVKTYLEERNYTVDDKGCFDTESVDYPDYAAAVAQTVAQDPSHRGILVCGTGLGVSIAANKVKGVRAALCHNEYITQMSREHNDANVLCIGARIIKQDLAIRMVVKFLRTDFEGGRHQRRVDKMMALET